MTHDPYLRTSSRQYRDLAAVYDHRDPLGWLPRAAIAAAALVLGAGAGAVVVAGATIRRLLAP